MTMRGLGLVLAAVCVAGCMNGSGSDMGNNPDYSLLPPNSDLTMFTNMMSVQFHLLDTMKDAFSVNCDDPRAKITSVTFTATETTSKVQATTSLQCPAGQNFNFGDIMVSDPNGTFDVVATANGVNTVSSQVYMGLAITQTVDASIFVLMTDM
jgi:hypothetical protein